MAVNYNFIMSSKSFIISSEKPLKPIAYTLGDPAGIGADIFLQYASHHPVDDLVVVGDERCLAARAKMLGLSMPNCRIYQCSVNSPTVCGEAKAENAAGILDMLDVAIDGCLNNEFSAMLTGPLSKSIINDAGTPFSGHTEYLAQRCTIDLPVMLLATPSLRVALVTTHLALREVSDAITEETLTSIICVLNADMKSKFAISEPRILVCGLNPHAGEGGHLGREEIEVIVPTLNTLRDQGINLIGPVPADTAFTLSVRESADVILAMYHDQGLPTLKAQGFGEAANITLGLPIIRTSVDHGTAFDLAGSGKANIGGFETALNVAREMVTFTRGASNE